MDSNSGNYSYMLLLYKVRDWLAKPKIMQIMAGRYGRLLVTLEGWQRTHVPLIAYDGIRYYPGEKADDCGLYYFVPKIASVFHLGLNAAICLFFLGILCCSLILGAAGFFALYKNRTARLVSLTGILLLGLITFGSWDVYVALSCAAIAIIPFFLYFSRMPGVGSGFLLFNGLAGALLCGFNFIRAHSGTAVVIFILAVIFFCVQYSRRKKLVLVLCLAMGYAVPAFVFGSAIHARKAFLQERGAASIETGHILWHQIFLGLGFLKNDYGLYYADQAAVDRVKSIAPNTAVWSSDYENILKTEVGRLVRTHPWFVIKTVLSKLAIMAFYAILFGNIGFLAAFSNVHLRRLNVAFLCSITFHSLYGFLTIPHPKYLLGFITFIALGALVNVCDVLEQKPGTPWWQGN